MGPRRLARRPRGSGALLRLAVGSICAGGLAGATPVGGEPAGLYRAHFERGLAALAAEEMESAAESFRRAGELAPDAPLWRAYLARAEGRALDAAPELAPSALGTWKLVPHLASDAAFDPTGERLLSGFDPATLWDARTGERIAVVSHRSSGDAWRWRFDATGRVLVGLGWKSTGMDLRDARTGEPILDEVLAVSGLGWYSRFEWKPAGTRLESDERRSAFQVALPDGVLRWSTPPTSVNERFALSPDGRRAAYLVGGLGGVLRLVDTADASTIARIPDPGWSAFFSDSGRFLATIAENSVLLVDAQSGERLVDPPAPERPNGRRWACCFRGDELVLVDGGGRVVFWDPASGRELRRIALDPPPVEDLSVVEPAAGGSRLILNNYQRIRVYDAETGRQVWTDERGRYDLAGALSADGRRLAVGVQGGETLLRDARTGASLTKLQSLPLGTYAITLLADGHQGVVRASDGTLRRIELATGRTSAFVTGGSLLLPVRDEQLLGWENGTALCLRDPATLQVRQTIELEPGEAVEALAPTGTRFLTRRPGLGLRCRDFAADQAPLDIEVEPTSLRGATFSPDGTRVALVLGDRVRVVDTASGATDCEFELQSAPEPGLCRFYGEDRLAIGWGDQEAAGVDVIGLPGGGRIARLGAAPCMFGGRVSDLRCDPDVGRIVFSVSACGYVAAYGEEDWSLRWSIDYGGGNPSQLSLNRSPGSKRLCVSGMSGSYARVVDIVTGEVLAKESVDGCYDLHGAPGDHFIVGATGRSLTVFSGETFELLYARNECAQGSAWIVRDGVDLEVDGEQGWDTGSLHLERGGMSYPADCWDAWILDPLGLVRAPLDVLPQPPRIISGPQRVVLAEGEQVEIALEIVCEEPLLGVQVEIDGRASELASVEYGPDGARATASIAVAGPWPADLRLRAVARSGVLSAPWRVRVEPFR